MPGKGAMKIGDTIYYRLKDGHKDYIQTSTILEETSRSWIVGMPNKWWARTPELIRQHGYKIPKSGTVFVSQEDAERIMWVTNNRNAIQRAIQQADVDTVLKIAELLGMARNQPTKRGDGHADC